MQSLLTRSLIPCQLSQWIVRLLRPHINWVSAESDFTATESVQSQTLLQLSQCRVRLYCNWVSAESDFTATESVQSQTLLQLSQCRVRLYCNWVNAEWSKVWRYRPILKSLKIDIHSALTLCTYVSHCNGVLLHVTRWTGSLNLHLLSAMIKEADEESNLQSKPSRMLWKGDYLEISTVEYSNELSIRRNLKFLPRSHHKFNTGQLINREWRILQIFRRNLH